MPTSSKNLIELETRFWQSMVDHDADTAIAMLSEPALMVSQHGAIKFDHKTYRRMTEEGPVELTAFRLRDVDVVFPNDSTAVLTYRVTQDVTERDNGRTTTQEMADSSTWVMSGDGEWRCVMHTETPVDGRGNRH